MAERFTTTDHRLTSIEASIDRVQDLVADPSNLALNRNQCAYLHEAQQAAGRFLQREDVRTKIHDASMNIGSSESKASAALIQLDSVVKRAENLVHQCRSNAWPKGALTLIAVKYDVLDIVIHLWWWMSVLRMVIDVPSSKLTALERVQLLNQEFELKLLSFDDLENSAEDDKRELLNKVKVEIQARNGESPDTPHLLLLQLHSLLTDQDEHSNPQLNEFTLARDGLLGQGSFGVVHKVKWCGYDCVLKQYGNWNADDVEVKSLKSLQHPHIVRFLRHWKSQNTQKYNSHMLMEGMERDLQDHISAEQERTGRVQPFSLPVAIDIMLQVMSAVWHMHERHIVHRDLKPRNVLVRKSALLPEGYVEVKLGDFGTAKADMMTSNVGALTFKAGTTKYRAPELSSREYTEGARNLPRRIDMWSFGIMCSQILTGLPPFSRLEDSALHKHIENGVRPSLPDDCPGYLRYCIESCWELKPENRPRASDMWRMLTIAQLRILGLVDHSCDSLFGFKDHSNKQASQIPRSIMQTLQSSSSIMQDNVTPLGPRHNSTPIDELVPEKGLRSRDFSAIIRDDSDFPIPGSLIDKKKPSIFQRLRQRVVRLASAANSAPRPGAGARQYTLAELVAATAHYKTVIGKGGFGLVYYGKMPDGKEVAVKELDTVSKQGETEFFNEVDLLSLVHHRHLVALYGCCRAGGKQMLVYEYIHKGSLRDHLDGDTSKVGSVVLDWKTRLNIGLQAALGLEYLHIGYSPGLIHRDVKSTNILITSNNEAKVADFGLSKLVGEDDSEQVMTMVKGTAGYLDPEFYQSNYLSLYSDVYSFGVVLLELITGRMPIVRSMVPNEVNPTLVDWARMSLTAGNIDVILDPTLRASRPGHDSLWKVAEIAMRSVEPKSAHRPTMNEVVQELLGAVALEKDPDASSNSVHTPPPAPPRFHSRMTSGYSDYSDSQPQYGLDSTSYPAPR